MRYSKNPIKYRKKPVIIEAMRVRGSNHADPDLTGPIAWVNANGGSASMRHVHGYGYQMTIQTLEGEMTADSGDFVIKGVKGEFYPCKPDIFEATYETVSDDENKE